ncbi:MAG TPA: hypothetical protein VGJ41_17860 [Nocardioides sp.]|jgi:dienelactone hydrolase
MNRPSDPYLVEATRLGGLYVAGRLEEAVALTERLAVEFPERAVSSAYARACVLAMLGRPAEALDGLKGAVAGGGWLTPRQLDDPDLDPLAELDGYADLVATMRARSDSALEAARATTARQAVVRPDATPTAVVVALHMAGVEGAETEAIWAPVAGSGLAVVVPESTLRNGDGRPCWDDPGVALRDVTAAVTLARGLGAGAPVVLAGGSQGAGVATRLALSGAAGEVAGFLAVVGAPGPDEYDVPRDRVVRGVLLAGGDDPLSAARQRAVHAELADAGHDVELVEVPGLAHVYPDDWGRVGSDLVERLIAH